MTAPVNLLDFDPAGFIAYCDELGKKHFGLNSCNDGFISSVSLTLQE
jgi:hypothetical protein